MTRRNRQTTEAKVLETLTTLIEKSGFSNLGINQLSRASETDKVLIYRYFDNLDGTLSRLAENLDCFPQTRNASEYLRPAPNPSAIEIGHAYLKDLSKPLTSKLLSDSIQHRNPLTITFWEQEAALWSPIGDKFSALLNNEELAETWSRTIAIYRGLLQQKALEALRPDQAQRSPVANATPRALLGIAMNGSNLSKTLAEESLTDTSNATESSSEPEALPDRLL